MELAWMMLANHAEAANGLLYISGGAWDTVTVNEAPPEPPEGVVAFVQGVLVIRINFHATEVETDYPFHVIVVDEDGLEIGKVEGTMSALRQQGNPPAWPHPANIVVSLTGLPLPRFGEYRIHVRVNREHKGDTPFRAVKGF